MARLLSLNVGLPRDIAWRGGTVHTAIWKDPVPGRRIVRRLNIDGDGQGDLEGHGGEHRAVYVYAIESHRYWEHRLGRTGFSYGQFGENFTTEGLSDDQVCIGDRFQVGSALFEVTQPRVTCYRVGIRMNEPRMAAFLTSSGRPGFYLRVLQEGEVGAGDAIVKVGEERERMTIAEANALLYTSPHPRSGLERALRLSALSPGWKQSFQALLERPDHATGNAGLAPATARPAPPGFVPLRVSQIERESSNVLSFSLRPTDGRSLATPLPGQFVVLRLRPTSSGPPLFRSYSLSGLPSSACYRVSVKIEPGGAAGTYLKDQVHTDDVLDVSSPRGSFILEPGEGPVILLSAGIGSTPVLAMLHALAAGASPRAVYWLHGARNGQSHCFGQESRSLLQGLLHGRSHIAYSKPQASDRLGYDYHSAGHIDVPALEALGAPRDADVYLCGPQNFLRDMKANLAAWGVRSTRMHAESFDGGASKTPGLKAAPRRPPHTLAGKAGSGPLVSFARSGIAVHWEPSTYQSLLELAEACDVPVRWSCRTGVCHTCESGLVAGDIAYQPDPLDLPAEGNLLICCSRPKDDVVIDI